MLMGVFFVLDMSDLLDSFLYLFDFLVKVLDSLFETFPVSFILIIFLN
jgi:hypothetical protein